MNLFDQHPAEAAFYSEIAVHKTWADAAETGMKHLAQRGAPFSADDLRELIGGVAGEPEKPNAYGGLFLSWSKQGLIRRAGYVASRGPKNNAREQKLWVGIQTEKRAA